MFRQGFPHNMLYTVSGISSVDKTYEYLRIDA
jgi:hypothetical protein